MVAGKPTVADAGGSAVAKSRRTRAGIDRLV